MKEREHLTRNQIAGYRAGAFDENTSREIGRHLLKCAPCRSSLPAPTVEGFWSAVMNERETEQASTPEESELLRHPIFSSIPKFFGQFSGLAWSGTALTVLLSISLFTWFIATRQDSDREVAQSFEKELNAERDKIKERAISPPLNQSPVNDDPVFSPGTNGNIAGTNTTDAKSNSPKESLNSTPPNNSNKPSKTIVPSGNQEKISSTRGITSSSSKCADDATVEMTIGAAGEAVTLKWKKVPKAAKYHLYVSDEEEILLDEFETEQGTSYVLKKPLDPLKTYKWKVVVTLENGDTVIRGSRKFTVKDLRLNQKKFEKKGDFEVRCSEDK